MLLDRGLEAIGGSSIVLPPAIETAVLNAWTRILHRLLSGEGEDRRAFWANHATGGPAPNLFSAASQSRLPIVGVLMANGANENARDLGGQKALDFVGFTSRICKTAEPVEANAAIHRTLERGPAFCSHSWADPSFFAVDARRGGGDGAGGARGDLPAGGAGRDMVRVRIYRPKGGNIFSRFLVR